MIKIFLALVIVAGVSLVTTSKEKESPDSSKTVVTSEEFTVPAVKTTHEQAVAAWD